MYLSRLVLNPRSHDVRRDLGNVQEMHRTIMTAFPDVGGSGGARSQLAVLYRLETSRLGRITLLVQSRQRPDWSVLPTDYLSQSEDRLGNPAVKPVGEAYAHIRPGARLVFRLRANPTRKIDTKSGPDGERRNGRRVELAGEERQVDWLRRKAEQAGFAVLMVSPDSSVINARALPEGRMTGRRPVRVTGAVATQEHTVSLQPVLFEGVLQVTDADRFRLALEEGIGPGKAYGCGLLSVCPTGGGSS